MNKQSFPKAVLFDMDGVLINSMPMHVATWCKVFNRYNIEVTEEEMYGEEGRVGSATIKSVFKKKKGIDLPIDEIDRIYNEKTEEVKKFATPSAIVGMIDFVKLAKKTSKVSVVTGSGQPTLMAKLNHFYPNCFEEKLMVSGLDVTHGKPHPEPYLKGLQKHNIKADQAIVIENAPMGVQAAKAANIFTIAINTGKLSDQCLKDAGADVVLKTVPELIQWWQNNYYEHRDS